MANLESRKNMGLFHNMYFKEYLILLPGFGKDLKDYRRNQKKNYQKNMIEGKRNIYKVRGTH